MNGVRLRPPFVPAAKREPLYTHRSFLGQTLHLHRRLPSQLGSGGGHRSVVPRRPNARAEPRRASHDTPSRRRGARAARRGAGSSAMLYGSSNSAPSQTKMFAHDSDVRIAPGRRAPINATRTPTSPTKMPLAHGHRFDNAPGRAPNHTPATRRIMPSLRRSHQLPRRRDCSQEPGQLVGRARPKRSGHPEYQKENELAPSV